MWFWASASQQSTGKFAFSSVNASSVPSATALPCMSSCMPCMYFAFFRLVPPVSKQMPLPTRTAKLSGDGLARERFCFGV